MNTEISAHDAWTRLHELLRQVKAGKSFTITNRGKAIADLVPAEATRPAAASAAIDRFQAFMREHPVPGRIDVKALIEEGRSAGVRRFVPD